MTEESTAEVLEPTPEFVLENGELTINDVEEPQPEEPVAQEEPVAEAKEETVEESPQEEQADNVFTLKRKGEEIKVDPDEAVQLAQKGYDYNEKMRELNAQRDAMMPYQSMVERMQKDPAFASHINQYFNGSTQEQPKEANFDELVEDDPVEAVKRLKAQQDQFTQQQYQQQQQQQQQQAYEQHLYQQAQIAQETVPDYQERIPAMREVAMSAGFTEAELSGVNDARLIKILNLAAQAMEGQKTTAASEEIVAKEVKKAPKIESPGVGKADDSNAKKQREAFKSAKRDGSAEAWASYLADIVT